MTKAGVKLAGQTVTWEELASTALNQPVKSVKTKSIARLWSGYGSVTQMLASTADGQEHALIAKVVDPPRQQGVGHERKLKSYLAEAAFYASHARRVLEAGRCVISRPLLVDVGPPSHFLIVLTDLSQAWPVSKHSLEQQDAEAALEWLAAFHALWWEEVPGQDDPVSQHRPFSITASTAHLGASSSSSSDGGDADSTPWPTELWDQGCYWHLATRQQELQSIGRDWTELKGAAGKVDAVLRGLRADGTKTARHRTLLHGDAKAANMLWSRTEGKVAMYDFQYVGEGLGARDVAKLLTSAVDADVLDAEGGETRLLQHYHTALCAELRRHGKTAAADSFPYEQLAAQVEVALADFVRFMAGWGMWGNAEWACSRTRQTLAMLDQVLATARTGW